MFGPRCARSSLNDRAFCLLHQDQRFCYDITMFDADPIEPVPVSDIARRFAEEYLIDFKAGPAALRAGYSDPSAGSNLLKDPRIDALIKEGKWRASNRVNISVDMVLENFRIMTTVTVADYFEEKPVMVSLTPGGEGPFIPDPQGRTYKALKSLDDWTDEMRFALKGMKHGPNGPEITLHDKAKTNELLGKYLGIFVDKVELTGKNGGPIEMITPEMSAKDAAEAYALTLQGSK